MRLDNYGENADEGKWTFRLGNLTWGSLNSKWGKWVITDCFFEGKITALTYPAEQKGSTSSFLC